MLDLAYYSVSLVLDMTISGLGHDHGRACSSRCCGLSSVMYHGWEGKCSEILATPSYSKNPRVNKDI